MAGKPCPPNCQCRKHIRTPEHNARIGISNQLTAEAKKNAKR